MALRISEYFYSIQGEGRTMGVPSVFVRLQACNILCKGDWVCDTIEVWKTGNKHSSEEFLEMIDEFVPHLKKGAHLIFTGGEPIIQKKGVLEAINLFEEKYKFKPYLEIETNGTLSPGKELSEKIDLFNCSFKLENSGVRYDRRIKIDVLKELLNYNTIYKIVVGNEKDYQEAKLIFDEVGIKNKNIYLMPQAEDINELINNQNTVSDICIRESLNFSTRMQIVLWNKTTGV